MDGDGAVGVTTRSLQVCNVERASKLLQGHAHIVFEASLAVRRTVREGR
jgi:hypothetical protein